MRDCCLYKIREERLSSVEKKYDIKEVNDFLYDRGLELLGSVSVYAAYGFTSNT